MPRRKPQRFINGMAETLNSSYMRDGEKMAERLPDAASGDSPPLVKPASRQNHGNKMTRQLYVAEIAALYF